MKNAKIMLVAIAVLTTVGGALAFKAKTPQFKICLPNAAGTACPVQVAAAIIDGEVAFTDYYNTSDPSLCDSNTPCPDNGQVRPE